MNFGLNVLDLGVVGDGITDDTAAIQKAINTNPGRTLYFPATQGWLKPSYYCGTTLSINAPVVLAGELAGHNGGTIIKFAKGVPGICVKPAAVGSVFKDFILSGGSKWQSVYPSQGVLPAGMTGDFWADSVASADDGFQLGAKLCVFKNVIVQNFGRHGYNLSNALCGSGAACDNTEMHNCYAMNCGGHGLFLAGGDSNACDFYGFKASVCQAAAVNDQSYFGNRYFGPKTDNNHIDGGSSYLPTLQPLASIIRSSGIVTVAFSGVYAWVDPAGGAFVPGHGITVSVPGDPTFNGTFIVASGGNTAVAYTQVAPDSFPSVSGAAARLATMTESWVAAKWPTAGAFLTSQSLLSHTDIFGLYTEGGQTPNKTGIGALQLGTATTLIGGYLGNPPDLSYGKPGVFMANVPGIGSVGFYGLRPSVNSPVDLPNQNLEIFGNAVDQNTILTRESCLNGVAGHARTLFTQVDGPAGHQWFANAISEPNSVCRHSIGITRDVNGFPIGGAHDINSQGNDPVRINMSSQTSTPCGSGGLQVAGPVAHYSPDSKTLVGGNDQYGRPYVRGATPLISFTLGLSGVLTGNDSAGNVSFVAYTTLPANFPLFTVNFTNVYSGMPRVQLTANTPATRLFPSMISNSYFTVNSDDTPVSSGQMYKVTYSVMGG